MLSYNLVIPLVRHNCIRQVLLRISGFMIIILHLFMSCLFTYILFHSLLFLSYHIMSSSAWYHLFYIYMLMLTTRFSMHIYDSNLLILVCLPMLATWLLHHHSPGEFWLLWILMSRSWSLDWRGSSCWGPSLLLWSWQTSCSSSPIFAPPCWLAASPVISWAPFCTVHICTFSLYSRICAYQVM